MSMVQASTETPMVFTGEPIGTLPSKSDSLTWVMTNLRKREDVILGSKVSSDQYSIHSDTWRFCKASIERR
jgi:hypothetical protein